MPDFAEILERFFWQFVTLFSEMAPFLLLGFLLAGILHVWVPNHLYVPKISKPNFNTCNGCRFHIGHLFAFGRALCGTSPHSSLCDGHAWRRVPFRWPWR